MFLAVVCIPFLYLFWPSLFQKKEYEKQLLVATAIIAVAGTLLFLWLHTASSLFLISPLYALLVLRTGVRFFRKKMRRNPKDPPRNTFLDDEYNWDRLFQFCYMLLALLGPLYVLIFIVKWPS
jgi:heme O synthase-like polyprenyltransferase